jgi:hypothetical protein
MACLDAHLYEIEYILTLMLKSDISIIISEKLLK